MTRNIDQAPQNPNQQPAPGDQPVVPLETVDNRGSQTFFGQESIPSTANPESHPIDRIDSRRNVRRGLFIAVGSVAAGTAIAAASIFGYKHNVNEQVEKFTNPTISQEYENITDPANMSSEQFDMLSRIEQMDYAGTKLNNDIDTQVEDFQRLISETGWSDYDPFDRPIVPADISNTPQEIWDQISLGMFTVMETARSGDVEEAKKLARGVAEGQEYDDLIEASTSGGAPFIATGIGYSDTAFPAKTSGSYSGVDANGLGVIDFKKERTATTEFDQVRVVAKLVQGTTPDSKRWILAKTLPVR